MKTKTLLFLCIFIYNCDENDSGSSYTIEDDDCSQLIAVDSSRGE